jgi:hypothetical protein
MHEVVIVRVQGKLVVEDIGIPRGRGCLAVASAAAAVQVAVLHCVDAVRDAPPS